MFFKKKDRKRFDIIEFDIKNLYRKYENIQELIYDLLEYFNLEHVWIKEHYKLTKKEEDNA